MPKLHKLICSAIDKIPPGTASQGSNLPPQIPLSDSVGSTDLDSEQPHSQEMAGSSQDTQRSKKQRLKPTAMLQQEIDWLKQQLAQERGESKEQLARERGESKQRHAELIDLQRQGKEENKGLKEQISKLTDTLMQSLSGGKSWRSGRWRVHKEGLPHY